MPCQYYHSVMRGFFGCIFIFQSIVKDFAARCQGIIQDAVGIPTYHSIPHCSPSSVCTPTCHSSSSLLSFLCLYTHLSLQLLTALLPLSVHPHITPILTALLPLSVHPLVTLAPHCSPSSVRTPTYHSTPHCSPSSVYHKLKTAHGKRNVMREATPSSSAN